MNRPLTTEEVPENLLIRMINYTFICALYHSSNESNSKLDNFLLFIISI